MRGHLAMMVILAGCGAQTAPLVGEAGVAGSDAHVSTDSGPGPTPGAFDGIWVGRTGTGTTVSPADVMAMRSGSKGRLLILPMGHPGEQVTRAVVTGAADVEFDLTTTSPRGMSTTTIALHLDGEAAMGTFRRGELTGPATWVRIHVPVEEHRYELFLGTPAARIGVTLVSVVAHSDDATFISGNFVARDDCDSVLCGGTVDEWSDSATHVTMSGHSGGPMPSTSIFDLTLPRASGTFDGTYAYTLAGSAVTFPIHAWATTHTNGEDALAVLGTLDELAQAWDVPASRPEPPLASTYLHQGIGRAAMIARLAPSPTPVQHADVLRIHDLATFADPRATPDVFVEPHLWFEVINGGTGGMRDYVVAVDDPLLYLGHDGGRDWVFIGDHVVP